MIMSKLNKQNKIMGLYSNSKLQYAYMYAHFCQTTYWYYFFYIAYFFSSTTYQSFIIRQLLASILVFFETYIETINVSEDLLS